MSNDGLTAARTKMNDAGQSDVAIDVFSHYYQQLRSGQSSFLAEDEIEPLEAVERLDELAEPSGDEAINATVIIKLNGGLGTSMGMTGPKTLLPVREGQTFLDIIVQQMRAARRTTGAKLPLVFMNSFRTRKPTLDALRGTDDVSVDDLPIDFLQGQVPKLRAEDLTPVEWPQDPELEWSPPGHGDIYTSLESSGVLDTLLAAGYRYASVSNADNLGARPDTRLASWFAYSEAPFAMEVSRRTAADRKGGHLAVRHSDGRIVLRESAQTAEADEAAFMDIDRHRYFNTNSLWVDLRALRRALDDTGGVLGLPLIANTKTVDPTESSSPSVIQIETAMGAAIEVFEGARAIEVPRDRFVPVKTTDDLLVVGSDVYALDQHGALNRLRDEAPVVTLDKAHYKTIDGFLERFPAGAPSLREATSLTVEGDVTFGDDVAVSGDVTVLGGASPSTVPDGASLEGEVDLETDA